MTIYTYINSWKDDGDLRDGWKYTSGGDLRVTEFGSQGPNQYHHVHDSPISLAMNLITFNWHLINGG